MSRDNAPLTHSRTWTDHLGRKRMEWRRDGFVALEVDGAEVRYRLTDHAWGWVVFETHIEGWTPEEGHAAKREAEHQDALQAREFARSIATAEGRAAQDAAWAKGFAIRT